MPPTPSTPPNDPNHRGFDAGRGDPAGGGRHGKRPGGGRWRDTPYASWQALWSAVRGRCPNCGQGRLFLRLASVRIRETCTVCGVRFERDPGAFLGPSTLLYVVAVTVEVALFLVLVSRYGLFPGLEWILVVAGVVTILLTWKPLKGLWVWLLWVSGLVWTDRVGST